MSAVSVTMPFAHFVDTTGRPLATARVFIGQPNMDPETNPKAIYWDDDLTIQAANPAPIRDGFIIRSGTNATVYVDGDYSITVRGQDGRLIHTARNVQARINDTIYGSISASNIMYQQPGTGGVLRNLGLFMSGFITPEAYGAPANGIDDDGPGIRRAIQRIKDIGFGTLYFTPGKQYFINSIVRLCDDLTFIAYGARIKIGPFFASRPIGQKSGVFMTTDLDAITATGSVAVASKNFRCLGGTWDGQNLGSPGVSLNPSASQGVLFQFGAWGTNSGLPTQAVDAKAFTGATFTDCTFKNFGGDAIRSYHGQDFTINGCRGIDLLSDTTLSSGALAQLLGTRDVIYTGNHSKSTIPALGWHGAVFLDWERPIEAITWSANVSYELNNGDGVSCEANNLTVRNARWSTFTGNVVLRCNGNGIGVDGCSHVSVTANMVSDVILGVVIANSPYGTVSGNYFESCRGNAIFGGANRGLSISANTFNGILYEDSTYQGECIYIPFVSLDPGWGCQIKGNFARDIAGAFCYDASNSICEGNTIVNAHTSNSPVRKHIIRTDSVRSIVRNNVISQGVGGASNFAQSAIFVDDTVEVGGNIITGSFSSGKYFIGNHRGSAVNLGLTVDDFVHLFDSKKYTFTASAAPPGSFFRHGDRFEFAEPTSGGWLGQIWTTAGAWRNYGAIA